MSDEWPRCPHCGTRLVKRSQDGVSFWWCQKPGCFRTFPLEAFTDGR